MKRENRLMSHVAHIKVHHGINDSISGSSRPVAAPIIVASGGSDKAIHGIRDLEVIETP